MELLKAIILGIIQGLAEFLPISSSGHLVLAQQIFGLSYNEAENLAFDVFLHFGTLVAVIIVFRATVWGLIKAFFSSVKKIFTGKYSWKTAEKYEKMLVFVIISMIPLFFVLLVKDKVEALFSSTLAVGLLLILTSGLLILCDRFSKGKITCENAKLRHPLIVGLFQAVATLPGISRSGATITGGLLCGFDKAFAVEFAFVMSIPAVLGANLLTILDVIEVGMETPVIYCILGAAVSAVVGVLAIWMVKLISEKNKFFIFSIYCAAVGIFAVLWSLLR